MLQNTTSLRKSAPGPPNNSDKHISCIAPATENISLYHNLVYFFDILISKSIFFGPNLCVLFILISI